MLMFFRKSIVGRYILPFLLNTLLLLNSHYSFALGNGPSTPEAGAFSKLETENLVNTYTGDFQYSIPVLNIGGYPITLNYNSNHTMEEEASWVGLGWNLNIGTIQRQMKGIPDDFNGDTIIQENNMKPNITGSLTISGLSGELIGLEKSALSFTLGYNNYNGFLYNFGIGIDLNNNNNGKKNNQNQNPPSTKNTEHFFSTQFGINIGNGGLTLSPSLSIDGNKFLNDKKFFGKNGFSFNMNSYTGMQSNVFFNITNLLQGSFSYNPISFSPTSPLKYRNYSYGITVKPSGIESLFFTNNTKINGTFSMQKLAVKTQEKPTTGFLYMKNMLSSENTLTDINTEKETAYIPGLPHIPITYMEPDYFNVKAQGISGTYRAYKNTAMLVNNILNIAGKGNDGNLDMEFGGGNVLKVGINTLIGNSINLTGTWSKNNKLAKLLNNFDLKNGFNNCYFKKTGENSKSFRNNYYKNIGETKAFGYKVKVNSKFNYTLSSDGQLAYGNGDSLIHAKKYNKLPEQSTAFVPVKKEDLLNHPYYNKWYKPYMNSSIKSHHIAQIQVVGENGLKYVFGCPAYNYIQKEVSFNVDTTNFNNKYVSYTTNDASLNNDKGLTNYFQSKTIPAYAYAYNITEVYSADYSDLTGNGPTVDDLGNYIVFKYNENSKVKSYKWRTPYENKIANYNACNFSLDDDNTANYVYGEKDIWYIDTIRTKDQIAVFYKSVRDDAKEVANEDGGVGSRSMVKLDSIKLWNLQDFMHLGTAAPILKKAVFKYNYSLCKGVPNNPNGGGKLTLIKLELTDGSSLENQRSSYLFEYGKMPNGQVVNKNYDADNMDRWGFFQQADVLNHLYPYTQQDGTNMYDNAYNWNLTDITLPTGGKIKVEYEPDDYRYVQDKKAMRMFKLTGIGNSVTSSSPQSTLSKNNNVIYFKTDIPSSLSFPKALAEFNKYFDGNNINKQLYFKARVNVNRTGFNSKFPNAPKEFIHGFAEIANKNIFKSGNQYIGAIELKPVQYKNAKYHPFSFAAIQYSMTNTSRFFTNQEMLSGNSAVDIIQNFVTTFFNPTNTLNIINSAISIIQGPINNAYSNGIGKKITASESWIRLNVRDKKYGGGSRVKKITYSNEWENLTGEQRADINYIKTYEYQTEDSLSSGVASYEPMVGGDEIPHRVAVTYENETGGLLAFTRNLMPVPKYEYYYPIGELQYPGPSVGYSRVVEKTIRPSDGTLANGMTISTFYTAKDYPVKAYTTPMFEHTPKLNVPGLYVSYKKTHAVVSEGFSIVLNDMVGKPKKVETFDGEGNSIKKMVYHYYKPGDKVPYFEKNNEIVDAYPGLETDVTVFLREESSISLNNTFMTNFDVSLVPTPVPPPVTIPSFFTSMSFSETYYRSCSVSKVIYQSGQIKSIDIMDRGADVSKKTLAYHPIGGSELITSTKDKFGPTYAYQIPGHYPYPQLGAASVNAGLYVHVASDNSGKITSTANYFTDGDRLIFNNQFYWVITDNAGNKYLIDKNGQKVNNFNHFVFIETSGFRNMYAQPVEQLACKENPILNNQINITASNRIISAGANTLTDFYSYPCDTCMYECNPNSYSIDTTLVTAESSGILLNNTNGTYKATLVASNPNDTVYYYSLIVTESKKKPVSHRLYLRKHIKNNTVWLKEVIIPKNKNTRLVDWYVNEKGIFILKEKIALGGGVVGQNPGNSTAKTTKNQSRNSTPFVNKTTLQPCNPEKYLNGQELYLAQYDFNGKLLMENEIQYDLPFKLTGPNVKKKFKQAKDIVVFKDSLAFIAGNVSWKVNNISDEATYVLKLDLIKGANQIQYFNQIKEVYELCLNELDVYGIGKTCLGGSINQVAKPINLFRIDDNLKVVWANYFNWDKGLLKAVQDFSNFNGIKLNILNNNIYVSGLFKPLTGKNHLGVLKFSTQGNLLASKTWNYIKNEKTGIFGSTQISGNLLLTGYSDKEGKYILVDPNLNIATRNTAHFLNDVAAHKSNDIVYTGISVTNNLEGKYFYTDIDGAVIGCTAKKLENTVNKSAVVSSHLVDETDTIGKVLPASFDELPEKFGKTGECGPMGLAIGVEDACNCEASISFSFYGNATGLIWEWLNLPSTAQVSESPRGSSVKNLCSGNYALLIQDTANGTSWSYNFNIGQMQLNTALNLIVNPFIHQLKNRWRPDKQWIFDTLRSPDNLTTPIRLEQQGHFVDYIRFWNYDPAGGNWQNNSNNSPQWRPVEFTTYHDRFGNPTESRDIIGNYSSAYFAYNGTLQEALAYNARSNEIGFDSFEDYYTQINFPKTKGHFRIKGLNGNFITGAQNHTGIFALKLSQNEQVTYETLIKNYIPGNPPPQVAVTVPFELQPGYCSDRFAPFDSSRTYLVSVWLKNIENNQYIFGNSSNKDGFVNVSINNLPLTVQKVFESPEIEGWVQYKFEFELQAGTCDTLRIGLINNDPVALNNYYFDDLKVEPKDALMKTYVYHPYRKLLMAELDENNYAVKYFYNYKDELEEVVKETEKGDLYIVYKKNRKVQK